MSISYGFFNSLDGDRVYNADDVNTFLEGLISPSGIYANVDGMLQVVASSGMTLNVQPGKAAIKHHWFRSNAAEDVVLSAAHQLLNRYDVIVLRLDIVNREIGFAVIEGTPATAPAVPAIIRNDSYYDLKLAQVYVKAGVTAILQKDIKDTRLNSNVCGIITGIIDQLDTSTFAAQLSAWMAAEQAAFEQWFETLTDELQVNTYIQQFDKRMTGKASEISYIPLDWEGYTLQSNDIFLVYVNGCARVKGVHYVVQDTTTPPRIRMLFSGGNPNNNEVYVKVLKSKIGEPIDDRLTDVTVNEASQNGITTTVTAQEVI